MALAPHPRVSAQEAVLLGGLAVRRRWVGDAALVGMGAGRARRVRLLPRGRRLRMWPRSLRVVLTVVPVLEPSRRQWWVWF